METSLINTSYVYDTKPCSYLKEGGELSLSGTAHVYLLVAVLNKGSLFRFCARGQSMTPFIKDGDLLTVSPLSQRKVKRGDIIAFVHPNSKRLNIHRILRISQGFLFTKGDNTNGVGEFVPKENILGLITMIERSGKQVHFGIGPERFLLSILMQNSIFRLFIYKFWKLVRYFIKR